MFRETVPDDRDVEVAFAEFHGCPQDGQVTASCRVETSTAAGFAVGVCCIGVAR